MVGPEAPVAKAPAEKRKGVDVENLHSLRAAAEASHREVAQLQVELKAAITRRNDRLVKYCDAVNCSAFGVSASAETGLDLVSCGLKLEAPKRPIGLPNAPTNFRAVPFALNGAVKLRCKRPVRRCFFTIEMTTDPQAKTGWIRLDPEGSSCAASWVIRGLQPGVLYCFRVSAHNTAGQGPWSDYLSVRPAQ